MTREQQRRNSTLAQASHIKQAPNATSWEIYF